MVMTKWTRWVAPDRSTGLVRWGASFAGAVVAVAATAMVMALWVAIGYGSGVNFFVRDLQWFFLGTWLGALLVGGWIAGLVSSKRGATTGFFDGLIVWALLLVGIMIPLSIRSLIPVRRGAAFVLSGDAAWALFGALIGGLLCAVIGGLSGGATPRTEEVSEVQEVQEVQQPQGGARPPRAS